MHCDSHFMSPRGFSETMSGENQQLVANEHVEFENNRLKFETSGNLPINFGESIEYILNE